MSTAEAVAGSGRDNPGRQIPPALDICSTPLYPHVHHGPALVVGSAANALEDVEAAREILGKPAVMVVNRTAGWLRADFIVAVDRAQAGGWRAEQEWHFGSGHFTMHGGRFGANQTGPGAYPWFDHWWPGLQSGGTSSWLGAKILAVMGFYPIVLCGVPLERRPYLDGDDSWSSRDDRQLEAYREPIRKDAWMKPWVRSMSGWTETWFGSLA